MIHSLTSVLFPKPAGAEISVNLSLEERPSFSRPIKCGRAIIFEGDGGIKNFVARIGSAIYKLYNICLNFQTGATMQTMVVAKSENFFNYAYEFSPL
jgi:hypothetical protein